MIINNYCTTKKKLMVSTICLSLALAGCSSSSPEETTTQLSEATTTNSLEASTLQAENVSRDDVYLKILAASKLSLPYEDMESTDLFTSIGNMLFGHSGDALGDVSDMSDTVNAEVAASDNEYSVSSQSKSTQDSLDSETSNVANYSGTNNQTEGVEEGDIIKTDGQYIYSYDLSLGKIFITKAESGKLTQVSSIDVSNSQYYYGGDKEIYINGDKLVVVNTVLEVDDDSDSTDDNNKSDTYNSCCIVEYNSYDTGIEIYDISDKASPKLLSSHTQDGIYLSSRLYNGYLYTVSTKYTSLEDLKSDFPCVDQVEIAPEKIFVPDAVDNKSFTTITSIKLNQPDTIYDSASIYGGGDNLYMSTDNLYIACYGCNTEVIADSNQEIKDYIKSNKYSLDFDETSEEPTTENYDVFSDYECDSSTSYAIQLFDNKEMDISKKEIKLMGEYVPDSDPTTYKKILDSKIIKESYVTNIYKFSVSDGSVKVIGNASTDGQVADNLCMDESDGILRMFSSGYSYTYFETDYDYYFDNTKLWDCSYDFEYLDSTDISNKISVFDSSMNRIAFIDGIAENENIYAARFSGNIGYVVTYENTDPLFTVDFSDPYSPKIIDELEMPGYSDNLYNFNGNLLGVGYDEDNRVKLEMYKVTKSGSSIIDTYTLDDTLLSYDTYNYKNMLISPDTGLIGISAHYYANCYNDYSYNEKTYYMLFKFENNKFKLINSLEISDDSEISARGLFIDNYAYVVCDGLGIYSFDYAKENAKASLMKYN